MKSARSVRKDRPEPVSEKHDLSQQVVRSSPTKYVPNITIPDIWRDKPEIIYEFLGRRQDYEQLCQEVAYVLACKLKKAEIEYSSIGYRAKELNSFLEKIERKHYGDPFHDITDLAGVRVVCLYPTDIRLIESIIKREFVLVEKLDKYSDSEDRFGYMAVHFLVQLGEEFSGARYDHLKNLVCEVQIRTVLQHAWALIDQHLVYKKKSSVPEDLRKRINNLSKVLEAADRQFERIKKERLEYIKILEKTKFEDGFLDQEINLDSLKIFTEKSFPHAANEDDARDFYKVLRWVEESGFLTISQLNDALHSISSKLNTITKELEKMLQENGRESSYWTNLELVHVSLAAASIEYRKAAGISRRFKEILEKLEEED